MSIAIAVLWRGFFVWSPSDSPFLISFLLCLKTACLLPFSEHLLTLHLRFLFLFLNVNSGQKLLFCTRNYFLNSGWICSIILSREIFWKLNLKKNHRKRWCQQFVFSASAGSRLHRLRLNSTLTVSIFRPTLQLCRDWNSANEKDNKWFSPRRGICCWIEIHMEKNPQQPKFKASASYTTRIWTHTLYFLHECLNH